MSQNYQINPVNSAELPMRVALPSTIVGEGVTVAALCEKWGFRFFGRAGENTMWAALPAGWKLDNMRLDYVWQSVRDERGRLRITMEYYRQGGCNRAVMTVVPRFEAYSKMAGTVVVKDNALNAEVYSSSTIKNGAENAVHQARQWLQTHFPDYENAMAYWETASPQWSSRVQGVAYV